MSDLNRDLESLVGDMGMSISDEAPTAETVNEEQPAQEVEQPQEAPLEEAVQEIQQEEAPVETPPQSSLQEEEISDEELESTMLHYLSERLGREVSSFDEIGGTQNTSVEIDERVAAINEFVRQTGRDPQDWFAYQAMNPSEMDDVSAVKNQLKSQFVFVINE